MGNGKVRIFMNISPPRSTIIRSSKRVFLPLQTIDVNNKIVYYFTLRVRQVLW